MSRCQCRPVVAVKPENAKESASDFDAIARHFLALWVTFARFDPRQIGPRLPPAAPRARRSSLKSCHWHDFRALITHGRRDNRASQTGAPRFTTTGSATHPLLAALRRPAIGSGVPPPGDRYSDPRTPFAVSMSASRFPQNLIRFSRLAAVPCTHPALSTRRSLLSACIFRHAWPGSRSRQTRRPASGPARSSPDLR